MSINLPVIILVVISIILFVLLILVMRNKTEGFAAGCNGNNGVNADYYTKQYPYYSSNPFYKPLSSGKTNLENIPATTLYTSLY